LYALTKDDLIGICRLMGPEKGRNLLQALLTRNLRHWHGFDEIEGIGEDWDDLKTELNQRARKSLLFPWSTPNHSSEHTAAGPNASGVAKLRRRRSSQPRISASGESMEAAVREIQNEDMC
jgi:hypothetical protein